MTYGAEDLARDLQVSRETLAQLAAYADLLGDWQARINLVGPATMADLWRRHMLDSAQLMRHLPAGACEVLDIGSGGGFPGLVLAAMGAGHVHLVEADTRKCAFLRAAARAMGCAGAVTVHNQRLEALVPFKADVVTARAFTRLARLVEMAYPFTTQATMWLLLKGQDVDQELTETSISWKMTFEKRPSLSDARGTVLVLEKVEPR